MLMPYGNLFSDRPTFKFWCNTELGMNEIQTSEHNVSMILNCQAIRTSPRKARRDNLMIDNII